MMNFKEDIEIPEELDQVISRGYGLAKIKRKYREKLKKRCLFTALSITVLFGGFIASINISPKLAEAMEGIPVISNLVSAFMINMEKVEGGKENQNFPGEVVLKKYEDKEQIIINFEGSYLPDQYNAVYYTNPQSVTVTLPGTSNLTILSDYKRTENESEFIKSIYPLITKDSFFTRFNIEIEYYSNVQIFEYSNPGQIVIELTKNTVTSFEEIYSIRTFSYENNSEFLEIEDTLSGYGYRILKDEDEKMFYEIEQFNTEDEANEFLKLWNGVPLLIEKRMGNIVPVNFTYLTNDYVEYQFINKFVTFLSTVSTPQEIINYIEEHKDATEVEMKLMLSGLTGILKTLDSKDIDFGFYDEYYKKIGTTTKEELNLD